jgi:hypothetical protein
MLMFLIVFMRILLVYCPLGGQQLLQVGVNRMQMHVRKEPNGLGSDSP